MSFDYSAFRMKLELLGKSEQVRWTFVIDTEDYAGGLERELFCFITGEKAFPEQQEFLDNIQAFAQKELKFTKSQLKRGEGPFHKWLDHREVSGDQVTLEVCTILPTPGWSNTGSGTNYKVKKTGLFLHPAYMSVGIFLSTKPPDKVLKRMAERAISYATMVEAKRKKLWEFGRSFNITGFRLVNEVNTTLYKKLQLKLRGVG